MFLGGKGTFPSSLMVGLLDQGVRRLLKLLPFVNCVQRRETIFANVEKVYLYNFV